MATLATLLRAGAPGRAATFTHVYVFVSLAAVGAGLVGLALVLRPAGATSESAAERAAEPATAPVAPAPAR